MLLIAPIATFVVSVILPRLVMIVVSFSITPLFPLTSIVIGMLPFCPDLIIHGVVGSLATVHPQDVKVRLMIISFFVLFEN